MKQMLRISTHQLVRGVRAASCFATLMLMAACGDLGAGSSTPLRPTAHTPWPSTVTVASSFQSELGCPGDWQPACEFSQLTYDASDDAWQRTFTLPAGDYEYKAALNGSWEENYGRYATVNGPNIPITLADGAMVKFYYDHKTHWVTSNQNAVIVTASGDFQSELGCPGDWQPDCLRSWLQDVDEDGVYTFSTSTLPVGSYNVKVAINESWDENYGQGGVPNGTNISFTVASAGSLVSFRYDATTHILTVSTPAVAQPFAFSGFFAPVINPPAFNSVSAGQAIPVKFSLGGDYGLDIFATGYPTSHSISCDGRVQGSGSTSQGTLSYNAVSGTYTYVWKTDKRWSKTCRDLVLRFSDGSEYSALFKFR